MQCVWPGTRPGPGSPTTWPTHIRCPALPSSPTYSPCFYQEKDAEGYQLPEGEGGEQEGVEEVPSEGEKPRKLPQVSDTWYPLLLLLSSNPPGSERARAAPRLRRCGPRHTACTHRPPRRPLRPPRCSWRPRRPAGGGPAPQVHLLRLLPRGCNDQQEGWWRVYHASNIEHHSPRTIHHTAGRRWPGGADRLCGVWPERPPLLPTVLQVASQMQ